MNKEKILKVVSHPIVSEKTTLSSVNNKYGFAVSIDSNKREIKLAIESLFNVDVKSVKTSIVKGKKKIVKRKLGTRKNWKKAMVRIAEGQMIDIGGS
jgi:large subunit ribosomal protein L23